MKYLVILLVVGVLVWWAVHQRQVKGPPPGRPRRGESKPALMVRCDHCGVHLPREEALPGPSEGFYCNEAHRRLGPTRR